MGYISSQETERLKYLANIARKLREAGGEKAVRKVFPKEYEPTENEKLRNRRPRKK